MKVKLRPSRRVGFAGSEIGPSAASKSYLEPRAFDPPQSVSGLPVYRNISGRSTGCVLTSVSGQPADANAVTSTSEHANGLDQKCRSGNEESYQAEDGLAGKGHLTRGGSMLQCRFCFE